MDTPQDPSEADIHLYNSELPQLISLLQYTRDEWSEEYHWIENINSIMMINKLTSVIISFNGKYNFPSIKRKVGQVMNDVIGELVRYEEAQEYGKHLDVVVCTRLAYIVDLLRNTKQYPCDTTVLVYIITDYVIKYKIDMLEIIKYLNNLSNIIDEYYGNSYERIARKLLKDSEFNELLEEEAESRSINLNDYYTNNEDKKLILVDVLHKYQQTVGDYTMYYEYMNELVDIFLEVGG